MTPAWWSVVRSVVQSVVQTVVRMCGVVWTVSPWPSPRVSVKTSLSSKNSCFCCPVSFVTGDCSHYRVVLLSRYICQVTWSLTLSLGWWSLNKETPPQPPRLGSTHDNDSHLIHLKNQLSTAIEICMSPPSPTQVSRFQVRRIRARNPQRFMLISWRSWVSKVSICQSHGERGGVGPAW